MARVPLLDRSDLASEDQNLVEFEGVGTNDLLRTLVNNPAVLRSVRSHTDTLWSHETGLTSREREIVILTVARQLDSAFEWNHHLRHAREAGLNEEEIRALGADDHERFDGAERVLIEYVIAYIERGVTDSIHERLSTHYSDETIVGICVLISKYVGTAYLVDGLGLTPKEGFDGRSPGA